MSLRHLTPHDYQTQNLEGKDLRGQPFAGKWTGANFRCITTGTLNFITALRHGLAWFLAFVSGLIAAYGGGTFSLFFQTNDPTEWFLGGIVGLLICFFGGVTVRDGLSAALARRSFLTVYLIVIIVALAPKEIAALVTLSTLSIGGFLAGSVGCATALILAPHPFWPLMVATLGLVVGASFGLDTKASTYDIICLLVLGVFSLGLGRYLACQVLDSKGKDQRYIILQNLAISICTWRGTSFSDSDLSDADFSHATLRHTDFCNAILTRTRWQGAQFHQSNLSGTYLDNPQILRLVTSLDGQGQNFEGLDLRGVNLDGANLTGANLHRADLSNASLRKANLTNATLAQTQLYTADLTGAILTGACIENWGISPETNLDNIECKEIFLRLPTPDNPDPYRKPDIREETFQDNDFIDFIAPILNTLKTYQQQNLLPTKTLDLYHRDGINPIAAAIALHHITQQHPQSQIQVITIEGVNKKIRIQASIASKANPSDLNTAYFDKYDELNQEAGQTLEAMFENLATQDQKIRTLETQIANATDSSRFFLAVESSSNSPPPRSAAQRRRDRLSKAIEQQNQHLDNWEEELQAVHDQFSATLSDSDQVRLTNKGEQLEKRLEDGENKLKELEEKLAKIRSTETKA